MLEPGPLSSWWSQDGIICGCLSHRQSRGIVDYDMAMTCLMLSSLVWVIVDSEFLNQWFHNSVSCFINILFTLLKAALRKAYDMFFNEKVIECCQFKGRSVHSYFYRDQIKLKELSFPRFSGFNWKPGKTEFLVEKMYCFAPYTMVWNFILEACIGITLLWTNNYFSLDWYYYYFWLTWDNCFKKKKTLLILDVL